MANKTGRSRFSRVSSINCKRRSKAAGLIAGCSFLTGVLGFVTGIPAAMAVDGGGEAPESEVMAYVKRFEPPEFRPGHELPALSITHHAFPLELMRELADNWGYALAMNVSQQTIEDLNDPESEASRVARLVREYPDQYQLALRLNINQRFRGNRIDFEERYGALKDYPDAFYRDEAGELIDGVYNMSPLASNEALAVVADHWACKVGEIAKHAPVRFLFNGGEYGFEKPQHVSLTIPMRDPAVREAWAEDGRIWMEFASDHKARQERVFRKALTQAAPGAYYQLYSEVGGGHYMWGRRPDWMKYDFFYRPGISDFASSRFYYRHSNSGFTGDRDMLSHLLSCRAQEIDAGAEYAYYYVSAGWESRARQRGPEFFADPNTYRGFLRMMYTTGSLGARSGHFGRPFPFEADALERAFPQYLVLGRVHAEFSWLDEFLLNSDLLPGPDRHRWIPQYPAYEFPTGIENKRVVARRHRDRPEWLLTAWAADGEPAVVQVNIPELGLIEIEALAEATVLLLGKSESGITRLDPRDPLYRSMLPEARPLREAIGWHNPAQ